MIASCQKIQNLALPMKYINTSQRSMFYGASSIIFYRARKLRQQMTGEEQLVWDFLKSHPLSFKFRRQHPLGFYIADFYCHPLKLVIEIDGGYHNNKKQKEQDQQRELQMTEWGISTLRFSNERINHQLEAVKDEILAFIYSTQAKL